MVIELPVEEGCYIHNSLIIGIFEGLNRVRNSLNIKGPIARCWRRFSIALCLLLLGIGGGAQVFDGFVIREVPIPPATAATIQTEAGFTSLPRCWRVYVCFGNPEWELQALAGLYEGGTSYPFNVTCPTCTGASEFYNNSGLGGVLASGTNPNLFGTFPALEFDSWFFIGDDDLQNMDILFVTDPNPANNPAPAFEAGGAFLEPALQTTAGTVVSGFWGNGATQGNPDAESKVLIAQLTTDGVFEGQLTLQFRRLNPDLTIFLPVDVVKEYNVTFSNNPVDIELNCPQIFLPVELLEFSAAPSDDRVNLMWITESEQQNERFVVERSTDLENWKEIGTLPGAGYSSVRQEYFMADMEPQSGVNYYRLRQEDTDGMINYSDTRSAFYRPEAFTFYPNPTSDRIWFKGDLSMVSVIRIYDMRGKVVLSQQTGGQAIREMDVNQLTRGAYVIEFIYPDGTARRNTMEVMD